MAPLSGHNTGYSSYRGRRTGKKILLVILLLLILLVACAFLFALRHVSYTDDGHIRFEPPAFLSFLFREEEPGEKPPEEEGPPDTALPLTGNSGGSEDNAEGQEPPESGKKPEPENPLLIVDRPGEPDKIVNLNQPPYGSRHLAEPEPLPREPDALAAALAAAGADGFVYTVRDNTGLVRFASETAQAQIPSAIWTEGMDATALETLCGQEGITSVARLNCFHDSYFAWTHTETAAICQTNGKVWYDAITYNWLDPAKEEARAYALDLAEECARLGFDELLLEEVTYPLDGDLDKIQYSDNTISKTEALVSFLQEMRTRLTPYGVHLSLLLDARALTVDEAYTAASGVDLAQMAPLVDALYVETADAATVDAILNQRLDGDTSRPEVVAVTPLPLETGNWYVPRNG